jgi:hypothetical protein
MHLQRDGGWDGRPRHTRIGTISLVDDPALTTDDLRAAWRDAARAAELAERLADVARGAASDADRDGLHADEIATLAGAAAEAATRAARTALAAVTEAADRAQAVSLERIPAAD